MPVNPFFVQGGLIGSPGEQSLLDSLVVESIQIHGLSVMYLPRTNVALDEIYLEDPRVAYTTAVPIEMYLRSWDQFEGEGSFMSTMGIEVRDQVVFQCSMSRFEEELGDESVHGLKRPNEGDLIWYPLNRKLFEVRYVDKFVMHYPLGFLQTWDIRCELFEYSGQTISTGVPEIDAVTGQLAQDSLAWSVATESGRPITTESGDYWESDGYDIAALDPLDDSARIQTEADDGDLIDFSELDSWSGGVF